MVTGTVMNCCSLASVTTNEKGKMLKNLPSAIRNDRNADPEWSMIRKIFEKLQSCGNYEHLVDHHSIVLSLTVIT